METAKFILEKFKFGELNPIRIQDTMSAPDLFTPNSAMQTIRAAVGSIYKTNAFKNPSPYKGIVLRIDVAPVAGNPAQASQAGDWFGNFLSSVGASAGLTQNVAVLIRVRVRIPELHAALPIPKSFPDPAAESPDHAIVDMYPQFLAESTSVMAPAKAGDLVWVDFGNRKTFEDPIYIAPVENGVAPFLNGLVPTPAQIAGMNKQWKSSTFNRSNYSKASTKYLRPDTGLWSGKGMRRARRKEIDFIVLHDGGNIPKSKSATDVERIISMWNKKVHTKGFSVGTHYYITIDGQLFQLANEGEKVNHITGPIPNGNDRSIGIDIQQAGRPTGEYVAADGSTYAGSDHGPGWYTKKQMDTLIPLLKNITQRRGIEYSGNSIIPHYAAKTRNHGDPKHKPEGAMLAFPYKKMGLKDDWDQYKKAGHVQASPPASGPESAEQAADNAAASVASETAPILGQTAADGIHTQAVQDNEKQIAAKAAGLPGL